MAISGDQFNFFALPAEIRNQIMEYVLVPGDVYVRLPKRTDHAHSSWISRSSRVKRILNTLATLSRQVSSQLQVSGIKAADPHLRRQHTFQQPGVQLLATCKQAYNEGHYMFYTRNTFHWQAGPVDKAVEWYANLQPKHKDMIKTVRIELILVDTMYESMDAVEVSASRRQGRRPHDHDGYIWTVEAMLEFRIRIWKKIRNLFGCSTVRSLWLSKGLEKVVIQCPNGRCVLDSQIGGDENVRMSKEFVAQATQVLRSIIQYQVYTQGWRKTKKLWKTFDKTVSRA